MQSEAFTVANIKCGGGATNVRNGLQALAGVGEVTVTIDSGKVRVAGNSQDRRTIIVKLQEQGYPEA